MIRLPASQTTLLIVFLVVGWIFAWQACANLSDPVTGKVIGLVAVFGVFEAILLLLAGAGRNRQNLLLPAAILLFISVAMLLPAFSLVPVHGQPVLRSGLSLLLLVPFAVGGMALAGVLNRRNDQPEPSAAQEALVDPLTGISSRSAIEKSAPGIFRACHSDDKPVSVLMLDLDHFKQVNDSYGHTAGDTVLKTFAEIVKSKVRASDLVGRFGGEEFLVILANSATAPAIRAAESIRQAVASHPFQHENVSIRVTVSIGIATAFPEDNLDFHHLLPRADQNLYRAKNAGRNRVVADEVPDE